MSVINLIDDFVDDTKLYLQTLEKKKQTASSFGKIEDKVFKDVKKFMSFFN